MFYSLNIQCVHAGERVVVFRWVYSPCLCRNGLLRFAGVCLILYRIHIWHNLGKVVEGGLRETVQVLLVTKDTWDPLSSRCVRSGEETERQYITQREILHKYLYHNKSLFVFLII